MSHQLFLGYIFSEDVNKVNLAYGRMEIFAPRIYYII
jgi:hypothetical protein